MKGAAIPAVANMPSPLFLWRVKVARHLYYPSGFNLVAPSVVL